MYMESKRVVRTRMMFLLLNNALFKWMRAISTHEGRGLSWPLGPHHVDGGVWKAWGILCLCHHTRLTRGTSREQPWKTVGIKN
jgi:hypothetical protein